MGFLRPEGSELRGSLGGSWVVIDGVIGPLDQYGLEQKKSLPNPTGFVVGS